MATKSAHSYVPVEVYLHSSYEPDAEYVDEAIEYRRAAEYDHASWQQAVMEWFWPRAREWNIRVLLGARPRLDGQSSAKIEV